MLSHFSCVQLTATLKTIVCQAPLSMGFSRQEYWSGLPCPSPGDLPNPGIKPVSFTCSALGGGFFTTSTTNKDLLYHTRNYIQCFIIIYNGKESEKVCMYMHIWGFPGGSDGKESACQYRRDRFNPKGGRSPGEGHGNPLQYSCLENPMDRGAWRVTVYRVSKSQIQLK